MSDNLPPTTDLVRVAVIGSEAAADLALPKTLTIRELIPRIQHALDTASDEEPADEDLYPLDAEPLRPYSLSAIGGTPFSLDATLATVGVVEGEQLLLCPLPEGPPAAPVVENIADAAAIHSARQFDAFEHRLFAPAALIAFLAVGALVAALAVYGWLTGYRWWSVGALAGTTVVFVAVAGALARRHNSAGHQVALATIVPLGLTAAAAVPGDVGAPRVFLCSMAILAWCLVVSVLTTRYVAVYTAFIVYAAAVAAAATGRVLWHLPNLTLGCWLIAVSLIVASVAPTAATRWARFPLPTVPAPGDVLPDPPTLAEIEDLPRKAAVTHAHQTGFIAASVTLLASGSVLMLWLPDQPPLLAWWVVVVSTVVTVLRMRIWHAAVHCLQFAGAPLLVTGVLAVAFTAEGHFWAGVISAAAAVAIVALMAATAAIKPRELPIERRRHLDRFENLLLYTIPPALLWLVGAISFVRNLEILS